MSWYAKWKERYHWFSPTLHDHVRYQILRATGVAGPYTPIILTQRGGNHQSKGSLKVGINGRYYNLDKVRNDPRFFELLNELSEVRYVESS